MHQGLGAERREVQAPQDLLPRRLGGIVQLHDRHRVGVGPVGFDGPVQSAGVWAEARAERQQEVALALIAQRRPASQDFAGHGDAGGFAVISRDEPRAEPHQLGHGARVGRPAVARLGLGDTPGHGPPLLEDGGQDPAEERRLSRQDCTPNPATFAVMVSDDNARDGRLGPSRSRQRLPEISILAITGWA